MHSQAMYRYRPLAAREDTKLAKADEIDFTIAPPVARAPRGRGTLNRLLEGTAYLFYRLENNFMRCLAIRGGACAPAPGEHMPVRLPDAGSRTAWAGRSSGTDDAVPGQRALAWRDGLQGESGKLGITWKAKQKKR